MDNAQRLISARACSVTAPAGCGKTHLIAEAVGHGSRELILTHTNAGVHAIRARTLALGTNSKCVVSTLDAWCLTFVRAYPQLSGEPGLAPGSIGADEYWRRLRQAAIRLLQVALVRCVIKASYSGVFIDEYQDCNLEQHELAKSLATLLPVRVLGDPLQAIFGFSEKLVDWHQHVEANFPALLALDEPYRWRNANPALGAWLQTARSTLLACCHVQFRSTTGEHLPDVADWKAAADQAYKLAETYPGESMVVVCRNNKQVVGLSRLTSGVFQCVEPMEPKEFISQIQDLERAGWPANMRRFISIIRDLTIGEREELDQLEELLGPLASLLGTELRSLSGVANGRETANAFFETMQRVIAIKRPKPFRWELWSDMSAALDDVRSGRSSSMETAFRDRRAVRSRRGRTLTRRHVGTQFVLKGLEFDHSLILDPGNTRELVYVSLTRSSKSLLVLGGSDWIR